MLSVSPVFIWGVKTMNLVEPQWRWINLLLRHQYDLNILNRLGQTALMVNARSCGLSSVEMVRLLLLAGANANVVDSQGSNALAYAIRSLEGTLDRRLDIVEAKLCHLIAAGCELNRPDYCRLTPSDLALWYGCRNEWYSSLEDNGFT